VTGSASALLQSATSALRRGDIRLAADAGARAAESFGKRGDADGRMRALNLLGAVAFESGALDRAREHFEAALALAGRQGDRLVVARARNNLASVADLQGAPLEALSLYRAALLDYQALGDRRGAGETCHNLSLVFRAIDAPTDAEAASEQALHHAEVAGDRQLLALTVLGRAELDLGAGNLGVARRGIERGRALMVEVDDAVGVLEAARLDARLCLSERRLDEAVATASQAADRAADLGSRLVEAELAALASLALRQLGQADPAARRRDQALAGFQRLGASRLRERYEAEWAAITRTAPGPGEPSG